MKRASVIAIAITSALAGAAAMKVVGAEQKKDRIYELRIYTTNEGKMDDLNARFRDHTMKLFEKHGITNVGYWLPTDEKNKGKLYYIVSYPDRESARKSWAAFGSDPEWKKAAADSEKNGKLVNKVESIYMSPTDYSPMK